MIEKSRGKTSKKVYWHPLSLQRLNSQRFIEVSNKILRGEYGLIEFSRAKKIDEGTGGAESVAPSLT